MSQTTSQPKDNIFKTALAENELFVQFINDYVPVPELKGIEPKHIKDVTTDYLPLNQNERRSDSVKRIILPPSVTGGETGQTPEVFVIALVEAQSSVSYRMPYRLLQYMTLIWSRHEKQEQKRKGNRNVIELKDFKYPPIIPIVLYNGETAWTAKPNFTQKVFLHETFEKYLPSFLYEVITLKDYSVSDLVLKGNHLSLVFILDKLRLRKDFEEIKKKLPHGYLENLQNTSPDSILGVIEDIIKVYMANVGLSADTIDQATEQLTSRRMKNMFDIIAESFAKEKQELINQGVQEEAQKNNKKAVETAKNFKNAGVDIAVISSCMGLSLEQVKKL